MAYDQLFELQKVLTKFGTIELLDTSQMQEGYSINIIRILLVKFFDIDDAKTAFKELIKLKNNSQNLNVSYVYPELNVENDLEKRYSALSSGKIAEKPSEEFKATTELEQKAAAIAKEYDSPAILNSNLKNVKRDNYSIFDNNSLMKTVPLEPNYLLGAQVSSFNSTTRFGPSISPMSSYREMSVCSDVSEGYVLS